MLDVFRHQYAMRNFCRTPYQQVKIINQFPFFAKPRFLMSKFFDGRGNWYYFQVGAKLTDFLFIGFHGIAALCAV